MRRDGDPERALHLLERSGGRISGPLAEEALALRIEASLAKRDGRRMIAVLEQHMRGRDFIVGDQATVADFNAAFTLDWANEEDLLDDAPALRAWLEAMYARARAPVTIAEAMAELEA